MGGGGRYGVRNRGEGEREMQKSGQKGYDGGEAAREKVNQGDGDV